MRLLLDQNLSPRLVERLQSLYPGTTHVRELGLASASDTEVWDHAKGHDFAIVSKDADFHQRSFLYGPPPEVIWVRLGNCTTEEVLEAVLANEELIAAFAAEPEAAFLTLP